MPELPEVETTVRGLRAKIVGEIFATHWTDWPRMLEVITPQGPGRLKRVFGQASFKKALLGRKVLSVTRRAKFVVINLSGPATLLIHMKLTGHLLVGRWKKRDGVWQAPQEVKAMGQRWNSYLRWVGGFKSGQMLGFSDLRRFGRFRLVLGTLEFEGVATGLKELDDLGPEPLGAKFAFDDFWPRIKKRRLPIKAVLLDQKVVAGLGNIYVDEALWHAKVSPKRLASTLKETEAKRIFKAIPPLLKLAIKHQGTTIGDYKKIDGRDGGYQKLRVAYQRHGEPCLRCGVKMVRTVVRGRGTHFCPKCQR